MKNQALTEAIMQRERVYSDAVSKLSDSDDTCEMAYRLREAVELVRCLRRLIQGCDAEQIHRAFGAPGDFGYETPIGAALADLYMGAHAKMVGKTP